MREGSLEAPTRHPIGWRDEAFYDTERIDAELRRVFDICHGCRRCFNLCDSFPRLFDLVDASSSGEVDGVASGDFKRVVDACTLCDMCFMTKCPYVPPHPFDVDFPHLMLRYRAAEFRAHGMGVRRAAAHRDGSQRQARRSRGAARQLGDPLRQQADQAGHGSGRGRAPRCRAAEVPRQDLHRARARRTAGGQPVRRRLTAARR